LFGFHCAPPAFRQARCRCFCRRADQLGDEERCFVPFSSLSVVPRLAKEVGIQEVESATFQIVGVEDSFYFATRGLIAVREMGAAPQKRIPMLAPRPPGAARASSCLCFGPYFNYQ